MSTQEANRAASNKMPPLWAAAAIVLLGWNEFLAVLYNPLWLFMGLIFFLFGKVLVRSNCTVCGMLHARDLHQNCGAIPAPQMRCFGTEAGLVSLP